MRNETTTVLRGLLGLVAVTNGLVGLLGVLPGVPISRVATAYYSASVAADPQVEHIAEMLGAYMLAIGVLAGIAAVDPRRYEWVSYVTAGLLLLRTVQRIAFYPVQQEVFGIEGSRYWLQTAIFAVVGLAVLVVALMDRRQRSMTPVG